MNTQKLIKQYNDITSARGGAPFHIYIAALYAQSPFDYVAKYKECLTKAEANATKFLFACNDLQSAEYSKFRTEYGNSTVRVRNSFTRRALQSVDQRATEHKDEPYERQVLRACTRLIKDQDTADLFEDLFLSKVKSIGYVGLQDGEDDYSTVMEFFKEHSLPEPALPFLKRSIYK